MPGDGPFESGYSDEYEEEEGYYGEGPASGGRRGGPGGPPRRGGRFQARRKVCSFCVDKVTLIDYKDVSMLQRFLDDHGKIKARRKTGTCARHQRRLALSIKRARHLALLPFTAGHLSFAER